MGIPAVLKSTSVGSHFCAEQVPIDYQNSIFHFSEYNVPKFQMGSSSLSFFYSARVNLHFMLLILFIIGVVAICTFSVADRLAQCKDANVSPRKVTVISIVPTTAGAPKIDVDSEAN